MLGDNPIRPPVSSSGDELEVQEVYKTIQGEGPYSGEPAVFIRLGGCNLACNFCDTEFESFSKMHIKKIVSDAATLAENDIWLAVITGGEPFRQPIEKLCSKLLDAGFKVQIETNGTLYRDVDERVEIVCSPKNQGRGYTPIRDDLLQRLRAIKFIISATNHDYSDVDEVGQSRFGTPVYVQPMDELNKEKNLENYNAAKKIANERGYMISVQLHKMLGID